MIKFEVGKSYDGDTLTIVARTEEQVTVKTDTMTEARDIGVYHDEATGTEIEHIMLRDEGELGQDTLYADDVVTLWDEEGEAA
jgi:hypothetical protein